MDATKKRPTGTMVKIVSSSGEEVCSARVQTNEWGLTIWDMAELVKQCLLGIGYHPDNVKDIFKEDF